MDGLGLWIEIKIGYLDWGLELGIWNRGLIDDLELGLGIWIGVEGWDLD